MASVEEIAAADDDERRRQIVDVLAEASSELIEADPQAFRRKFRKMAADPFAFYRGTAPLFYSDVAQLDDRWADERTASVWIQGDLHAENYGTYMDAAGILVFDVNASTRRTSGTSPGTSSGWRQAWRCSGSPRHSRTARSSR